MPRECHVTSGRAWQATRRRRIGTCNVRSAGLAGTARSSRRILSQGETEHKYNHEGRRQFYLLLRFAKERVYAPSIEYELTRVTERARAAKAQPDRDRLDSPIPEFSLSRNHSARADVSSSRLARSTSGEFRLVVWCSLLLTRRCLNCFGRGQSRAITRIIEKKQPIETNVDHALRGITQEDTPYRRALRLVSFCMPCSFVLRVLSSIALLIRHARGPRRVFGALQSKQGDANGAT